jgi:hypothetical protein
VAERKNQTIMDMARSMLKEKHLSNEYWGDAVLCSIFILNRSLTKTVRDHVPWEAWDGKPCNVSHFRIFGCVAFAHVPTEMRRKLDDRSERCIFVGYIEESRAYKLHNPITQKYVIIRDVQFKEDEAWDGSIDKSISKGVVLPHEDDDGAEQVEGDGQMIPHIHTPATRSPTRQAPDFSASQFRTPRTHERGDPSGYGGHQSDSQVSSESNPTLASLRNIFKGQKTRSIRE